MPHLLIFFLLYSYPKNLNNFVYSSLEIPIPLSSMIVVNLFKDHSTDIFINPLKVNLIALERRLKRIDL